MFNLDQEKKWVEGISKLPAAKNLVSHLAAMDAIAKCGGQRGIEPPVEQASTWKRIFSYSLRKSDAPLGIRGGLPKCVAICNLSGHYAIYTSETVNLATLLCLTVQDSDERITRGVRAVLAKADELSANILIVFCLPFQSGLERMFWELRTFRKLQTGEVCDGECCFSVNDGEARAVPPTMVHEHWPDAMFEELLKTFASLVVPVSLDRASGDKMQLSDEQMLSAITMLKAERKKLIDTQRREIEVAQALHVAEVDKLTQRAAEAEAACDAKVCRVAEVSRAAGNLTQEKIGALNDHVRTLNKQLAAREASAAEAASMLSGLKLEHEQELRDAQAKLRIVEMQLASANSSHAKQIAELNRSRKELIKAHESSLEAARKQLEVAQKEAKSMKAAAGLVSCSAEEARRERDATEAARKELEIKLGDAEAVMAAMQEKLTAASPQVADGEAQTAAIEEDETLKRALVEKDNAVKKLKETCRGLEEKLRVANRATRCPSPPSVEKPPAGPPVGPPARPPPQMVLPQTGVPLHIAYAQGGNSLVDPLLESMISQMHSALQTITNKARSATTTQRAAEHAQARLEALQQVLPQQQIYYDPNVMQHPQQKYYG